MPRERTPSIVGLIPARAGSKRVKNKNIKPLGGHPVIAYTIAAARESGIFGDVIVSTDSEPFAEIARHYGASVPFLRPDEYAGDRSPDIEWIEYTLARLRDEGKAYDCFAILRPTSPFRKAETIRRAWDTFLAEDGVDSLRAVEKCKQHPGKMWVVRGRRMFPLLPIGPKEQPWHSSQYPTLPEVFIQNASLEIAWSRVIFENRTIAGDSYVPFITEGDEGYDVNDVADWIYAEYLLSTGEASLPPVSAAPLAVDA
jgi:CMP-N,N'-diacetyllegionaminic acid synthase